LSAILPEFSCFMMFNENTLLLDERSAFVH
jgi:hypothetical protein